MSMFKELSDDIERLHKSIKSGTVSEADLSKLQTNINAMKAIDPTLVTVLKDIRQQVTTGSVKEETLQQLDSHIALLDAQQPE